MHEQRNKNYCATKKYNNQQRMNRINLKKKNIPRAYERNIYIFILKNIPKNTQIIHVKSFEQNWKKKNLFPLAIFLYKKQHKKHKKQEAFVEKEMEIFQ